MVPMNDEMYAYRHSAAHVLATAVLEVFPTAKLGIGPPIQDGFYYDFDLPRPLTEDDLAGLEERMRRIVREDQPFECREVAKQEALDLSKDQPYKRELIELITSGALDENLERSADGPPKLTVYRNGPFVDLCRGPHVKSTGVIAPDGIKLLHVSSAYWRGNERNPQLQRIYGTAWRSKADLDAYLHRLQEAKERDHRVLGRQLGFFTTSDAVGQGLILWQPKAAMVRYLAERFSLAAHQLNGYEFVNTPHIGKATLWETSGHLDFYKDSMYAPMTIDADEYYLKPMNCPFHIQIYKVHPRSYRELPLRLAEFGTVYRYELSGALHGMTRVRGFTQDDAHIFCTPEQLGREVRDALRFSLYVLREFGLEDITAYLATKPREKAIGGDAAWASAQDDLRHALEAEKVKYAIDEGGGAFYGPKIDLKLQDALGRDWQLSTVQLDFNLPERFDLHFTGPDGERHRPYMVHRALFGSMERFFALLVEHYKGAFPLWLAPKQAIVIPITDAQAEYARGVAARLRDAGLRAGVDDGGQRMNAKIREAQEEKVPYALVVGKREVENGTVSVRDRLKGDLGPMTLEAFLDMTAPERAKGTARALPPLDA
jgi:threonyl-tRNA synthetase